MLGKEEGAGGTGNRRESLNSFRRDGALLWASLGPLTRAPNILVV